MPALHKVAAAAFLILATARPATSQAGEAPALIERGRTLVETNCASCHAVGKTGESVLPKAPLFRNLGRKYPIENLSESLAEGIMTGHPAMPQFVFSPAEIDAILAYLASIAEP